MRSLNVRLLAIIVGLGVVLAISTFALNRFQVYRHADFYYKTAQRTKDSDDIEQRLEAVKNLRRYVNLCPDDNVVRAELGVLMVDIAKTGGPKLYWLNSDAFSVFESVLRYDYNRSDVRRNLVEVAIATRRYPAAKEHLDVLLEDSPHDAELLTWLGQCQTVDEDYELAKESFKKAIENDPGRIEPYTQLVAILQRNKKLDGDRDLNPTVKVPAAEAETEKPDTATTEDTPSEAPKADDKNTDDEPADEKKGDKAEESTEEIFIEKEDEDHPDTWMNRLVAANSDSPQARLMRGKYLLRTHKPDEAEEEASQALRRIPLAMRAAAGAIGETAKALRELPQSLPSPPASAQAAIEELDSAARQMETAAKSAATLAQSEEEPGAEEPIATALKSASQALKATGEALVAITEENDEDDDIAETLGAVTAAKAKAVAELDVLKESLQGALLLLAECQANKEQIDEARRLATMTNVFFPHSASVYSLLSRLESTADNQQQAREWVDRGLDATEDAPTLLWMKANFIIDDLAKAANNGQERRDDILADLSDISDKLRSSYSNLRSPAFIGYLSARAAFVQGQWARANKEFDTIRDALALMAPQLAVKSNQMAARCFEHLGRPDLAQGIRKSGIRAPSAISRRFGGVARMLSQGRFEDAAAELEEMKETGNLPDEAWILLAQHSLNVNRSPNNTKKDWHTFDRVLQEAAKSSPEDVRLPLIAANALIAQEKMDEAHKLLTEACNKNPQELIYWQSLIRIAQQKEDWQEAEKLLLDARKEFADSVSMRIAEAVLIINRDKKESAPALKRLAENTDDYSDQDRVRLLNVLANCARRAGDLELSQQLYRKAADGDPTNLKLRIFLFEIAAQKKDDAAMAAAVEEIHEIEDDGPFWHYYEALRLATKSDEAKDMGLLDEALEHLAQAKNLRANWDHIPMLVGRIELRKGNRKAAVDNLTEAVDQGSRDPQAIGMLVTLLYEQGRDDEAERMIGLLEEQDLQISDQASRLQAQGMFKRGEQEQGLEIFRKIAENSEDFRDHLRLGQILGAFGQQARLRGNDEQSKEFFVDAEKSLRKAAELAPDETFVWVALVQFLSRCEKESQALEVISEARKTVDKQRLPLTLARCFQSLGRGPEAQQQYLTAVANSDGKDSAARLLGAFYWRYKKYKEVKILLDEIIEGKQPASEYDVAWARRLKAQLLYKQGGLAKRWEAIALVDENLKKDPSSIEDIRQKAKLLATFGNPKELRESKKLIETLLSLPNPNPDDRYLMATVLLAKDDWPGVTQQMQQLLSRKNIKSIWLQFYISSLLNRNEIGSADAYLKRLELIEPHSFAVAKFTVRILTSRGQYDQALEVLDKYANNSSLSGSNGSGKKEADRQKTIRLVNSARTLEDLIAELPRTEKGNDPKILAGSKKLTDRAEAYWREIAKLHPQGTMQFVRFLSKHGKRDEALTIVETAWKQGSPASIAQTVVSFIIKGKATPAQVKRVERILNDATLTFGESSPLLLAMAELRSIQRRYEEAESLYRKVLDKEPRNVVALNNLAVFLALRNIKADEALELMNQAIAIAGPRPTLRDSRASVHISRGDWESALADIEAAISGKPTPTRFFHQAQALYAAKQKNKAETALKKAHDMGLDEDSLQPLERPAYRQLREDLK